MCIPKVSVGGGPPGWQGDVHFSVLVSACGCLALPPKCGTLSALHSLMPPAQACPAGRPTQPCSATASCPAQASAACVGLCCSLTAPPLPPAPSCTTFPGRPPPLF